ncbi:44465_t:CDS:2 [Gigaspora margarita]|uniref:44465_t:CDS:1 n=1 Tax=Gigaspora margarita TaxID=4874 RepID=A0ABN7UH97_GIGMA|nr:44465_t:CDS:2 [Gigaspora margarita]
MSHSSGQQRGPYMTMACTNCRRRHTKCSEEATCTYCATRNLKCTYVKSGKKRGPKATKRTNNVFESNFDEAANIEQEQPFTLTENQFNTSIPSYFNYSQEPQPMQSDFFSNQICTDTNYIMPNSNTECSNTVGSLGIIELNLSLTRQQTYAMLDSSESIDLDLYQVVQVKDKKRSGIE